MGFTLNTDDRRARLRLLEERHRRAIRRDLTAWCREALAPLGQAPAAHHRLLIGELERVARGETDRLMVLMPPGSAKSSYASVLFPAWFLAQRPNLSVIGASHTADLAEAFSRRVINTVRDYAATLGYGLTSESVKAWSTTNGGSYKSAGVGGPITGRRADCAIIDDPVKSRAEADSEVERERAWNWFNADLRTRLKPGGAVVLIMTRWHASDLGGRLLETQGDAWRVLKLPAIAGDHDPLGRAPGEWLWSDDAYGYAAELRRVRAEYEASGAMRDWSALYQQDPRPAEGALFKTAMISTVDAVPAGARSVRAWDLAATAKIGTRDPDWTVGARMARTPEGRFVIDDMVRLRGGPDEVLAAILATAARDGRGVAIRLPEDPGQAGKAQVLDLTRRLAGYVVSSVRPTGDKATRATPLAAQCNVGNVSIVRAAWNAALLDELSAFPSGAHDDICDALADGFAALIAQGTATVVPLRI